MKEGYATMKELKGIGHEVPIIKAPYLENLLKRQIEVPFANSKCIETFEEEDKDFR